MDPLKWPVFLVCICLKVAHPEASSWIVKVPSSVKGLPGSCVVIPCSFTYPDPGKTVTGFTGIWNNMANEVIFHPVHSKIMEQYRDRTELLGDIRKKNCTLKIDPLRQIDQGPFHFRIEIADYDKFSYKDSRVSITMISELNPISFSVKDEAVEGHTVSASCSVSHSCPYSPPGFSWSHSGGAHFEQEELKDGHWKAKSTLTFQPTSADHNKTLQCTVTYKGGRHHKASKVLKVKYSPVNVKVEYKSEVREGESVQMKCSSDAHPPASSYRWHNVSGAELHQGSVFMLPSVSRHHTGALYCTAKNIMGQGESNAVYLNVLYPPEIKPMSSCSLNANVVTCVCIVESKPPSTVNFVLADRLLPSSKLEKLGPATIGTLQAEGGSFEFVFCLANNTQGIANVTLLLPVNSKMQSLYIVIGIGAGVIFLIPFIAVGAVKKWGRSVDASTSHMSATRADKNVELPQYAATKRKEDFNDVHCPGIYANDPEYGNMENDWDDAIYANM